MSISQLSKQEIIWRYTHHCKDHGHNFLEHPQCLFREGRRNERIGFLDIETTNLKGDFGIVLSWCIKPSDSDKMLESVITKKDLESAKAGDEDKKVVRACLEALPEFDKVVGYYSKRFDVPFLRTRALSMNLEFPTYGTLNHVDLYDTIKRRFKMSSNRLEQACRVLLGKSDKTKIEYKYWRAAGRGEANALRYVLDHNRKDVLDLEKLYNKTIEFTRKNDTSI